MNNPIKIIEKIVKNDLLELHFTFPEEEKSNFKTQIKSFWDKFKERDCQIEATFAKLTNHIQSVKSSQVFLRPYTDKKKQILTQLSIEINDFIRLHNKDSLYSMVDVPKIIRQKVQDQLKTYEQNSTLLKDAYRYEHIYLKELINSFNNIKTISAEMFSRYEFMSHKMDNLRKSYVAIMKMSFNEEANVDHFILRDHIDFKEIKHQSTVIDFIRNCLQTSIKNELGSLDEKAKIYLDSFLLTQDFIQNFKEQYISVETYISEYQSVIKFHQEILGSNDYKSQVYSKSNFLEQKNKQIEEDLLSLWKEFSAHYEFLLGSVKDLPQASNKLKKQIIKVSLNDFFSLDRAKIIAQVITDVSVDDFEEAYSFLTWQTLESQNPNFCQKVKNNFYEKYSSKYSLEQLDKGVFFQECGDEFQLVFITFDNENSPSLDSFLKRIELKYQKNWQNIKSVRSQKLGDMLDVIYKDFKIAMPVQYYFFNFKDPGILQSIKKIKLA